MICTKEILQCFKLIRGHTLMIHYEKYDQQAQVQIYKFILL